VYAAFHSRFPHVDLAQKGGREDIFFFASHRHECRLRGVVWIYDEGRRRCIVQEGV